MLFSEQYNNNETLKTKLSHTFNPQERENAYKCEFRNRRGMEDKSPSDFGFALRCLSLKAFPSLPYSALETHVRPVQRWLRPSGIIEIRSISAFKTFGSND